MYGIYLQDSSADNQRAIESVLLFDGAWANECNYYMREHGVVWYQPLLFSIPEQASEFARNHGHVGERYVVRRQRPQTGMGSSAL